MPQLEQKLKLRAITEADRAQVTEWMKADKYHAESSPDLFFTEGTETIVFEDATGPILYVNLTRAIRAFVQFAPNEVERTREALPEAFQFVKGEARKTHFREIIFESLSRPLILFCKRKLFFRHSPNEYKTSL